MSAPARLRTGAVALLAAIVGVTLGAAACTPAPSAPLPRPTTTSPFAACPLSTADPATGPDAVPDVTLPCFTGDEPVALNRLGRPALINLWASWCPPCRDELPALQAFADEAGDQVLVLGVVTDDGWVSAAETGAYLEIRFPSVFDPDKRFQQALGRAVMPMTLFVAGDGTVRATDMSGALTLATIRALAAHHLGYAP